MKFYCFCVNLSLRFAWEAGGESQTFIPFRVHLLDLPASKPSNFYNNKITPMEEDCFASHSASHRYQIPQPGHTEAP